MKLAAFLCAIVLTTSALANHPTAAIWIKYNDLPRRCRETLDRERGRHEVKQVLEIRREGRVYFRALIDERGADRAIFLSESGRVVKETDFPDLPIGRGSYEKLVRYEDCPREVRRTLDRERGRNELRVISFVRRDNREFYRAIVDTRGDDIAIRINNQGRLLSIDEVEDFPVGTVEVRRHDYEREQWVRHTDLPRDIRQVIEREAHGDPIKQIFFVERNGRRFYRVVIDEWDGDRILRIAEDGYIYAESEVPDIAIGRGGYDKNRFGHEAGFAHSELPWAVRQTLDRERRSNQVKQIQYVRRGNHSFYRCVIDYRGDDVAIRISDEGRVLSREEVEDVAFGRAEVEECKHSRETWVKYASVPSPVQRSLDRYRNGRGVFKIIKVEFKGRVSYRCNVDTRPYPTWVRITDEGRLVGLD